MLVAAHVAHGQQPWPTCRRRCTSKHCSSRFRTARRSTHETRGQASWSRTLPVAIQPREGADPSITDQDFSLWASPACGISPASRSGSSRIAPRAASASLGTASVPSFWRFRPARSYAPGHTYWNRVPATRGQVCWPCPLPVAQQLCGGADPSINKAVTPS